jgi:hypothetical protein
MSEKQRKIIEAVLLVAAPAFAFAATWAFLGLFHSPYAEWLTVETQPHAVVGRPLDVRLTVKEAPEQSKVTVNIYLLGKNRKVVGWLPAPSPPLPAHAGDRFDFRIDVKATDKMAFIQLVIWLSPTGDWRVRTKGADSDLIPVSDRAAASKGRVFKPIRTFAIRNTPPDTPFLPGGQPPAVESLPLWPSAVHLALAVLLAWGGVAFSILAARRGPAAGLVSNSRHDRRLSLGAAVVLFLLAVSEFFMLEERIAGWGRELVVALGLYNLRQSYQKLGLSLIAAGLAAVLVVSLRPLMRRSDRAGLAVAGVALAVYVGLALAGALSFHYVDVLKTISVIDALKAVSAATALGSGLFFLRDRGLP